MSRLRRLRSWWLSLYLPRRPLSPEMRHLAEEVAPAALLEFRSRLEAGTWARIASTDTKAHGPRTPETATTEECSFCSPPGEVLGADRGLTLYRLPSSFTGLSSSGDVTGDRGGSGAPLDSAG